MTSLISETLDHSENGSKSNPKPNKNNQRRNRRPKGVTTNKQKSNSNEKKIETRSNDKTLEDDDRELCLICAEPIEYVAINPCNHRTCHVCSFRMKALYKKEACLVCRTEHTRALFSDYTEKNFSDFTQEDINIVDDIYNIDFTSEEVYKSCYDLLEYYCQFSKCHFHGESYKELSNHIKEVHHKLLCNICNKNKKIFPFEIIMYNKKELLNHQNNGDKIGSRGHPICEFCKHLRFYDDDDLLIHMRDNHFKCHVCEQIDSNIPHWFKDYDSLFRHFKSDHIICPIPECLEKKFIAFGSELDFKAHMIEEHGKFAGNDRTIHSFGNNFGGNRNGFQSQLSTFNIGNDRYQESVSGPQQLHTIEDPENIDIKRMRLIERARHYLPTSSSSTNNDISKFQELNSSFENNKINAFQLIENYKILFQNRSMSEIGIIIEEFSKIIPNGSKNQKDLLREGEKSNFIESEFPALPGSSNFVQQSTIRPSKKQIKPQTQTSSFTRGVRNDINNFPALPHTSSSSPNLLSTFSTRTAMSTRNPIQKTKPKTNINDEFPALPHTQSSTSIKPIVSNTSSSSSQKALPKVNGNDFPALPHTSKPTPTPTPNPKQTLKKKSVKKTIIKPPPQSMTSSSSSSSSSLASSLSSTTLNDTQYQATTTSSSYTTPVQSRNLEFHNNNKGKSKQILTNDFPELPKGKPRAPPLNAPPKHNAWGASHLSLKNDNTSTIGNGNGLDGGTFSQSDKKGKKKLVFRLGL